MVHRFRSFIILVLSSILKCLKRSEKQKHSEQGNGEAYRCKSGVYSDDFVVRVLDGDLPSFFEQNQHKMSSKKTPGGDGSSLKSRHQSAKQPLLNQVLNQPKHVLVKEYFKEMDLKNQAYYFIIQSGLMDQFVEFNQKEDE